MSELTVSAADLRDRLDELGVDANEGASTSAYTDLDTSVNLNAVAIGLGLEDVVYDPDRFPGIVYEPDAYEETVVVVFGNVDGHGRGAELAEVAEVAPRLQPAVHLVELPGHLFEHLFEATERVVGSWIHRTITDRRDAR